MRLELVITGTTEPLAERLSCDLARVLGAVQAQLVSVDSEEPGGTDPDLCILLVDRGSTSGIVSICARLQERSPHLPLIAAGEAAVHDTLQSLLHRGLADVLFLPVSDAEMSARVRRALACTAGGVVRRCDVPPLDPRLEHIVGRSPVFAKVLARLPTLAGCDAGVLILGETGTGKEVLAQALHYLSPRASRPWVPINCGAIPLDLVESELFGHTRGAFTTASASRAGLVEEAEGGTLFLDDVDCLPLAAQAKLLRLLQEKEYRQVGSNTLRRADIRVIAASSRDLAADARQGSFRQDLFYRLNVLSVSVPPLRERREDIPMLALHFLQAFARQMHRPARGLTPQALRKLVLHEWPGNVRELQHAMERAVLLGAGPALDAAEVDAGEPIAIDTDPELSFRDAKSRMIERFERDYLEQVLARCNGNITHAAREAGKNRRALFELIRKYRIEAEGFRAAR